MKIMNLNVYKELSDRVQVLEDGTAVVPYDFVKYILSYYFDYPDRSHDDTRTLYTDTNGEIRLKRIYPDKLQDLIFTVKKKAAIEEYDIGTEFEYDIYYEMIRQIAEEIGLKLILDDYVKLYIDTYNFPDHPLDGIQEAQMLAEYKFSAYRNDDYYEKTLGEQVGNTRTKIIAEHLLNRLKM